MPEEKPYKIEHDRPNCIGCAACAAIAPEFWEMNDDGKSDVIGAKRLDDGTEELDISDDNFEENKEAAEACPVNVIHLIKKKNNEKII